MVFLSHIHYLGTAFAFMGATKGSQDNKQASSKEDVSYVL